MQKAKEMDRQRELNELGESMRKHRQEISEMRAEHPDMQIDNERAGDQEMNGASNVPEVAEVSSPSDEKLAISPVASDDISDQQHEALAAAVEVLPMLAEEPALEGIQEVSEEMVPSPSSALDDQPEPSTSQTPQSENFSKCSELTLPSEVLDTLIYNHHRTQDDELIRRLTEVEQK